MLSVKRGQKIDFALSWLGGGVKCRLGSLYRTDVDNAQSQLLTVSAARVVILAAVDLLYLEYSL